MIVFRTPACLSKLDPSDPSYSLVKKLIDRIVHDYERSSHRWDFDRDGGLILISPGDLDKSLEVFHPGKLLRSIPFEGAHIEFGHYIAVSLLNNQATLSWIFPDQDWLPDELRNVLDYNLIPSPDNSTI